MPKPSGPRPDRVTPVHDGANDLATFGALPVALIAAPALAETGPTIAPPAARMAFAPAGHDAGAEHGDQAAAPPLSGSHALAPSPAGSAMTAPLALVATGPGTIHAAPTAGPPQSAGIATFVPMPHGSGAIVAAAPVVTDATHTAIDTAAPAAAMPAGESIESMHASVAAMQEALTALAERLPPVPGTVAADHLADAAAATLGSASATIDHLGSSAGMLIESVADTLDHVVSGAPDVSGIVSDVGATLSNVADLTAGLTPASGGIVAPVEATLDHVVAAASDVGSVVSTATTALSDATDAVASATAPVLDHIAGADPVGGIATLVGMVSAADAFNLHDAGSDAGAALAPALGIAGSVDLLADVVPHEALLGIGDHHGDGIAGIDLHDGLFGHG
ncbi:hypothetical protein SPHINGO361_40011 [Sphingomonas sp. EC-HK361]|uniref:hypothetical protein n=1 Tax=Sphingomonas sp. EC-HK361 TaxID=2038397 RepID=UPI0012586CB9|nr:hypothetical protein [Sphingomonas sp. EC-HK361]VVT21779.1 hypothetical protein SPHINGO361_40011 [Sphingomonas sp. EC-HK361]